MTRLTLLDPTRAGKQAQDLETKLRRSVVGQDEAIDEIVRAYQTYVAGLSPVGRPVENFLFLGPTGSGKTRLVEATAESLLNNPRAVLKIDCAQTDKVKLSFVLFDEIEKASDALWNLLLGILDKGVLTLGDNRRVDFSASMIFMTSNLGAAEISSLSSPQLGFHSQASDTEDSSRDRLCARIAGAGVAAARRKFTPEFINRLDRIVAFKPLAADELRRIADIEIGFVLERLKMAANVPSFALNVNDSAREFLLEEGTDARYGARHLKLAIERLLVQPLANLIASGQIRRGDCIRVSHRLDSQTLLFFQEADAMEAWSVAGLVAA